MHILVTGGAGFIGSHTVDALLSAGHRVRILDNFSRPVHLKGRPPYLQKEAEVIEGDVRSKADWQRSLKGIDAVYHFAAYQDYLTDFSTFFHINSVGTALLYEVAVEERLPIQKVVFASSQAVYGEGRYQCPNAVCRASDPEGGARYPDIRDAQTLEQGKWDHACGRCGNILIAQRTDESRVNPQNQYAVSKYTQELIALNLGRRYGIPSVGMRYSIVQGPRQSLYNAYSGACRIFCLSYFLGKSPVVYEDGKQLRDFVNIQDVVAANLLVLGASQADYQVFNVGGGEACTVAAFAETVRSAFGSRLSPRIVGAYRFGDTRHIHSSIERLRKLGWKPRFNTADSVADYAAWLRSQGQVEDVLDYAEQTMKERGVVRAVEAAAR